MSATHYTQWIYRGKTLVGKDGQQYELRINCGTNDFDWGIAHPGDSILLDKLKIIDFGKVKWQRYDEDADLVASERTFVFKDAYIISGIVNGSPTGEINLANDKTSLVPFIFNDKNIIYHIWLSQINADGSIKETYWYGHFDPYLINSLVKQITKPMTSDEMKLTDKTLKAITMATILKAHSVEELVSGSRTDGVPDGLVNGFRQSDMTEDAKPWYGGLVVKKDYSGPTQDVSALPDSWNIKPDTNAFQVAYYPGQWTPATFNGRVWQPPFGWSSNMYGVHDGFQGLTYAKIISKIGQICGFTFSSSDADNIFQPYLPTYTTYGSGFDVEGDAADRYNLSRIADPHFLDAICVNYNTRFGIRAAIPNELHFGKDTNDGSYQTVKIDDASNATPIVLTLDSDIDMVTGISNQRIVVTGVNGNTAANGVHYMTVIDGTHVSLQDSGGSPISGSGAFTSSPSAVMEYANRMWWDVSNPVSYDRSGTLSDLLKIICFRFGYIMDWDINQTTKIPKLILRNALKSIGTIPDDWTRSIQPKMFDGTTISERVLAKKNVVLNYVGEDLKIYCPTVYGPSIEIQVNGRMKQWGKKFIYTPSFFINNSNKDIFNQWDTFHRTINIEDNDHNLFINIDHQDNGWLLGANDFYYLSDPPSLYNSHFPVPSFFSPADFSGFYTITYEDYGNPGSLDWDARLPSGATIHDGLFATKYPDNRFNSIVSKAIYYANVFLHDITTEKRGFHSAKDNDGFIRYLKPLLTGSWQDEDGTVTSKLIHTIEIDELKQMCDVEFVPALPDYTVLTSYPIYVKGKGTSAGGGLTGGSGGTGTGAGNPPAILAWNTTNGTGSPVTSTIQTYATNSGTTYLFETVVVARRTGGSGGGAVGDGMTYKITCGFKNVAGVVTSIGALGSHLPFPDMEDDTGVDIDFTISGTNILLEVTTPPNENLTGIISTVIYKI